jgi:hypothetical protein
MCLELYMKWLLLLQIWIFIESLLQNILNSECWVLQATDDNPNWQETYSFKDRFQVPSMDAKNMEELTHRFAKNHTLLLEYTR